MFRESIRVWVQGIHWSQCAGNLLEFVCSESIVVNVQGIH